MNTILKSWFLLLAIGFISVLIFIDLTSFSLSQSRVAYLKAWESQQSSTTYRCPPCGCSNDLRVFDSAGTCDICGMTLVPYKNGIERKLDDIIAPLFFETRYELIYTKIIYPIFLISCVFSVIMFVRSITKRDPNTYLYAVIFILALYGFKNQFYGTSYQMFDHYKGLFLPLSFISALGAISYFYTKSILDHKLYWNKTILVHLIPAMVFALFYIIGLFSPEDKSIHLLYSPYEVRISHFEQIVSVILGMAYVLAAIRLKHQKMHHQSEYNSPELMDWLRRFTTVMLFLFGFWIIQILVNYHFYQFSVSTSTYYPLWIVLAIFLTGALIEIVLRTDFLIKLRPIRQALINFAPEETARLKAQLERLMVEKELYLNNNLSLDMLAEALNIKPKLLSAFLNGQLKKSFYTFVNEYRVKKVESWLLDDDMQHLTIEALSELAGFKSKSTFNSAFKKMKNMTPKEYIQNHRK